MFIQFNYVIKRHTFCSLLDIYFKKKVRNPGPPTYQNSNAGILIFWAFGESNGKKQP